MALSGKEIVVGVSGSIAAYKSADLVSKLVQKGAGVSVVMTQGATNFVGPITFQALTQRRVLVDSFASDVVKDPTHVTLTDKADLIVIAPATANIIGKIAHGLGDDMLTSLMLAISCPVLIAPAMNDRMWNNAIVQENLASLKKRGMNVIDPEEGFLVERREGKGRLADPERILAQIETLLK